MALTTWPHADSHCLLPKTEGSIRLFLRFKVCGIHRSESRPVGMLGRVFQGHLGRVPSIPSCVGCGVGSVYSHVDVGLGLEGWFSGHEQVLIFQRTWV